MTGKTHRLFPIKIAEHLTLRPNEARPKGLPIRAKMHHFPLLSFGAGVQHDISFRKILVALILACFFSGCRQNSGGEEIPSLLIAVTAPLEKAAGTFVDEFNRIYPQGNPLSIAVVPDADLPAAAGREYAAVLDWGEGPAGDWSARIGWTGILFVVHSDNSLGNLSTEDAEKIYLGWIGRWEDVGGRPGEIHAIAYGEDSGLAFVFDGTVLGGNRPATGLTLAPSVGAMRSAVLKDPLAIGFAPAFEPIPDLRALTLNGVAAIYPNFLSGKYPFRIPIYLNAKDPPPSEIEQFAGWIQSVPCQTILMQLHPQE